MLLQRAFVIVMAASVLAVANSQITFSPDVPRTWDDAALSTIEVPAPRAEYTPKAVPADYYYKIPVRPIYRGYVVYEPGKEPPGYFESLKQRDPAVIWNDDVGITPRLQTEADWIAAGEVVFDAAIFFDDVASTVDVRNPGWYKAVNPRLTGDGILPYTTYVVRQKGKVELGNNACGFCHTRVQPDGQVIKGAQGNFEFDRAVAFGLLRGSLSNARNGFRTLFGAPWLKERDPAARADTMTLEELASRFQAIPAGVAGRHRASVDSPPAIPDLIGIRDRRFLDRTGLVRHRGIEDLMRYAALNNELDFLSRFGDFVPAGKEFRELPDPTDPAFPGGGRYSDTQLYALAKFLYSLTPPPNPNPPSALSKQGERVFQRAGCAACHTPPLYTNNKLVPADGFTPPASDFSRNEVMPTPIGTDPTLTLYTRRGTGYYKVPSLRGVRYRGPFEHNGSVATLEDWLDPRRLRDDYVPTGFRGYGIKTRAVKGHRFGLSLSKSDKDALIAFLKTL